MTKKRGTSGKSYLFLAICALLGIGLELVLAWGIEPLFGISMGTYTTFQIIIHWSVVCVIWFVVGVFVINFAKQKYQFHLWEEKSKLKGWQYLGVAACLLVSVMTHYLDWGGFKPLLEFQRLGVLKFVFQYIYYFLETFLMSLMIIFGQKACEKWFEKENVPYGGIVLALTWGLLHILSKGSVAVGLMCAFGGFLYGSSYLIVDKDYRKALPLMYLMFVL